ncbi:leader peptidase (prepilin peptidase) / N-methyltransferase [Proteiniborus sp. DW1]|uniref:prepilin peptidase n=1 Tax=Proteiniborus sp. DW1 TaxID=1889883 RepID=UPI00092DFD03|nr:A24 family peptidase [Proteiniborus sp. DW1]SCG83291.1 leader peptidase (prepilin peptidase) / N-methyltransferase [Proteiniborus sp. DW1]
MYIQVCIFGCIIGSFLNVCIYRIPREESIVYPSSHCPECNTPLKWYDLLPIFSFLFQKGKCRYCGMTISPQYLIVELLSGILYTIIFYFYAATVDFVFYSLLISILITISYIDYHHQIIPDSLVGTILLLSIFYKTILFAIHKTPFNLQDSILALLIGGGLFLIIAIASKGGIGGGDIKLISVLGFILGIKKTILTILLSFIIGAAFSIFLLILKKKERKDVIPFGPFINIAFSIALFFGDSIINWYVFSFLI